MITFVLPCSARRGVGGRAAQRPTAPSSSMEPRGSPAVRRRACSRASKQYTHACTCMRTHNLSVVNNTHASTHTHKQKVFHFRALDRPPVLGDAHAARARVRATAQSSEDWFACSDQGIIGHVHACSDAGARPRMQCITCLPEKKEQHPGKSRAREQVSTQQAHRHEQSACTRTQAVVRHMTGRQAPDEMHAHACTCTHPNSWKKVWTSRKRSNEGASAVGLLMLPRIAHTGSCWRWSSVLA